MKPEDVKLGIFKNLKILFNAIMAQRSVALVIFILFMILYGCFLSLSTPSFMTNMVANIMMHLLLTVAYSVGTILIAAGAFYIWEDEDDGLKWEFIKIQVKFREDKLAAQKAELENVDSIILGKGDE